MRNPSSSCFIALMTHEAMSINQNTHPDALRNPANPLAAWRSGTRERHEFSEQPPNEDLSVLTKIRQLDRAECAVFGAQGKAQRRGMVIPFQGVATLPCAPKTV
jgi:hypothetical protein